MKTKGLYFPILILSASLTGCMVGPNFHTPSAPATNRYTEGVLPKKTVNTPSVSQGGKAQQFVMGQDIPAQWWALFHSPDLNRLVEQGLVNSTNLASAQAALRVAQETLNAQIGASFFPSMNLQVSGQRNRVTTAAFGGGSSVALYNLYNVSVPISYTLDLFGGLRREVESLRAQVDYQQYQLEAAYLTLTANIVTTAITAASLQAQIQATHELVNIQQDQLRIIRGQFNVGAASEANVLSQEAQLAQTQASLPPLEQSLAQSHHALAVLVGSLPSEVQIPRFDLDKLKLPTQLPVSLPSLLVQQRPDIRASEALLASASAQVGVATANLLPRLNLTGSYGYTNTSTGNLFSTNTNVWNFGGALVQPLFNGGALRAQKRGAVAAYEQAAAQYRQTVLVAFQNVADTLRALEHDAQTLRAQKSAEIASKRSMILTQQQFKLGSVSYVLLLTANQQYQQARIGRIQAQAARYNDTAALFQALGGGWWNQKMDITQINRAKSANK